MITVIFNGDEEIIKSNNKIYQWDIGQKLKVLGLNNSSITDVHFTFKGLKTAYVVKSTTTTTQITSDIPNKVLTYGKDIIAYLCTKNSSDNIVSVKTVIIPVIKRNMPENYMYDDDELVETSIDELQAEIQRSTNVDTDHETRISSLEDAKTNVSGETFETLKDRIDNDVNNFNSELTQLYNFNDVNTTGFYDKTGKFLTNGKVGSVFIQCHAGQKLYINRHNTGTVVTFWKSDKTTYISNFILNGNEIIIPNNNDVAYVNIPIRLNYMYDTLVTEKLVPNDSVSFKYGESRKYITIANDSLFTDIVKSRINLNCDYDGVNLSSFPTGISIETGNFIASNTAEYHWVNCLFNTITADICQFLGYISIAENNNSILSYDTKYNRFLSLNKHDNKFVVIKTYSNMNLRGKKIHISVTEKNFIIKDFYTSETYVSEDISEIINSFCPSIIGLGQVLLHALDSAYSNKMFCTIYASTDFVPPVPYHSTLLDTYDNHWYGKKWYAYGTSLTDTSTVGKFAKYVELFSGMIRVNKGIGGGGIVANNGNIKNAIMNTTDGKLDADLITLETGANDTSVVLGTIYDTGDDTYCGALNQCIRYLQANTNAQIVVISSTNSRYEVNNPSSKITPEKSYGTDNHTKYDQWKAIREVCAINSVPYIPMGESGGLGYARMNANDNYNVDQIHHSELGGYNLGKFVWHYLKNIPCWYTSIPTE